ncbi:hypothetical protein SCUCBS95973_009012 [Sporothrix curviconia]|uniref:Uncharacterized protein n=1 Tax=Sporothrix curviconia TaxID=1260050 RepID=A0ABP0CRB4_9PEZI
MAVDIPNDGISLRFKYGPQTVFLFVDCDASFDSISAQLLEVLRERYPRGLLKGQPSSPDTTPVPPAGEDCIVVYGLPRNPRDLRAGWKALNADGENPTTLRLKQNSVLAFALQTADEPSPEFRVEIPAFEDED